MEDLQNAGTKIDAPILGNGDLLAAVAGDGRYPQFWFTTNDFWQMESAANWEFFHDNSSAKCDPAVSGGSPRDRKSTRLNSSHPK